MGQFDGSGYGCNRGVTSDVAGAVCGNQEAIGSFLDSEKQCRNNTQDVSHLLVY